MINITAFLHKTNKSAMTLCASKSELSNWPFSPWAKALMAQHLELDFEISAVNSLLNTKSCNLIQLDVKLKRLTKAVLTHLELEAQFLVPMLTATKALSMQKNYLNEGFEALFNICRATTDYVHSLKLSLGNCLVTANQSERIVYFLDEIKNRLNDENFIYAQMTETRNDNEI